MANRAVKYQLFPTEEQAQLIRKTVGCARFVYNNLLDDYNSQLQQGIAKPKIKLVTFLKQNNTFLNEVDSLALMNGRARLEKEVSRKEKGSKNRDKARARLAKFSRHIANKRLDFTHKLSRYYVNNYDVIVVEDIDMQAMSRTLKLGKSVCDLGFGRFREQLAYKCMETDSVLIVADRWFASSKTCHECGTKNPDLKLSDRVWVCPVCGCILDRDYNAALNLRDYFMEVMSEEQYTKNTVGTAGIYASGEKTPTLREIFSQVGSLNEEKKPLNL